MRVAKGCRGLKTWPWGLSSTAGEKPGSGAPGTTACHLRVQDLPEQSGCWPSSPTSCSEDGQRGAWPSVSGEQREHTWPGKPRNLISWERTSSWSQPMIGFCPEAQGLSVLANFIQKKDKQAHSSFSYQPRVAEVEEVQSVVSLVPEHHLGHTGGPAGRKLFLNRPNLTRFSFWQELSC